MSQAKRYAEELGQEDTEAALEYWAERVQYAVRTFVGLHNAEDLTADQRFDLLQTVARGLPDTAVPTAALCISIMQEPYVQ